VLHDPKQSQQAVDAAGDSFAAAIYRISWQFTLGAMEDACIVLSYLHYALTTHTCSSPGVPMALCSVKTVQRCICKTKHHQDTETSEYGFGLDLLVDPAQAAGDTLCNYVAKSGYLADGRHYLPEGYDFMCATCASDSAIQAGSTASLSSAADDASRAAATASNAARTAAAVAGAAQETTAAADVAAKAASVAADEAKQAATVAADAARLNGILSRPSRVGGGADNPADYVKVQEGI